MANNINITLTEETLPEFIASIIDNFESFLDEKHITLKNSEKEDAEQDGVDPDEIANIYGSDYGTIQTGLEDILVKWSSANNVNITENDSAATIYEKLKGILSDDVMDQLYRKLWMPYVTEDVKSHAENSMDAELTDEDAEYIANSYIFDGEYDCNIPYWDNIENLIVKFRNNG